jgi:hypothetical protein
LGRRLGGLEAKYNYLELKDFILEERSILFSLSPDGEERSNVPYRVK